MAVGRPPEPTPPIHQSARDWPSAPRIGMVSASLYPLDPRMRRQAEALVAHGYHVEVICQRQPGEPALEQLDGVTVRRIGGGKYRGGSIAGYALIYGQFMLRALALVARLHHRRGLAAVHVYSMPEAMAFTALWPRLTGVPLIYDAADLTTELYAAKFGDRGRRLVSGVLRLQEWLGLRLADLVVTVHDEYRRRLLARGVPEDRIRVIMNLPDEQIFRAGLRTRPAPEVPRPASFTVAHHGSLVERYGVDLAVRAVARLRDRIPGLRLLIYGDGDLRPRLAELVEELGLADRVFLSPGYIPVEELVLRLAEADAAVVPNRLDSFTETILPTKLFEYLALGIPTVVTRTRTVLAHVPTDVVEYCRPDDVDDLARAIERIWADAAYRELLARNARAYGATHRWADQAAAYCAAVDELTAGRRRPAVVPILEARR